MNIVFDVVARCHFVQVLFGKLPKASRMEATYTNHADVALRAKMLMGYLCVLVVLLNLPLMLLHGPPETAAGAPGKIYRQGVALPFLLTGIWLIGQVTTDVVTTLYHRWLAAQQDGEAPKPFLTV